MRLLSLALILGVAVGRAAATAEYVVVFSTAEACAVHDMSKAHLILKEPSGGHEGVAASCAPECGGTAMGFLSAECVPPLLEAAGGLRMTLYHTAQGCANEDETDIVRILFNLHDCFTISNGESLTILSSGPEDQEVCSVRMTCTGDAGAHGGRFLSDMTRKTARTGPCPPTQRRAVRAYTPRAWATRAIRAPLLRSQML